MKYLSVDIETTGLDPETCDIIEFAAILEDTENPLSFDQLHKFHCYFIPKFGVFQGEPYALSLHFTPFRRIADRTPGFNYIKYDDFVQLFMQWLHVIKLEDKITFAGKNFSAFDLQFLKGLLNWKQIKYHHRALDPGILYWNPKTDVELPSTSECLKRAGLPDQASHQAMLDAWTIIQLLRVKFNEQSN